MEYQEKPHDIPADIYEMAANRYPIHIMHEEGGEGYKTTMRDRMVYCYGVMDERACNKPISDIDPHEQAHKYAIEVGGNMTGAMQNMFAEIWLTGYNASPHHLQKSIKDSTISEDIAHNGIPQDIWDIATEKDMSASERLAYIQGRTEERTAQETFIEGMWGKTFGKPIDFSADAVIVSGDVKEKRDSDVMQLAQGIPDSSTYNRVERAWEMGYNAANHLPKPIKGSAVSDVTERAKEYSKTHDGVMTNVEEGLLYSGYVDGYEDGYNAAIQSRSAQPTSSASEIANRIRTEFDKYKNSVGIDWAEMAAHKIVAANLPVGNQIGWADSDIYNAMRDAYVYGQANIGMDANEWLREYKKTHPSVHISENNEKALEGMYKAGDANGENRGRVMAQRNGSDELEQMQGAYEVMKAAHEAMWDAVDKMHQWLQNERVDAINRYNIANGEVENAWMEKIQSVFVQFKKLFPRNK